MNSDLYDAIESVLASDGSCNCDKEALRRLWLRDRADLAANLDSPHIEEPSGAEGRE